MKINNKIYKPLGVLLLSALFLISCNDSEGENITSNAFDKSNIETAPLEVQIEYANKHLLDIGKVVAKLARNKEFEPILYSNIQKRVNTGYYNSILVKDLITDINTKSSNNFFISEEDKSHLQKSLEAFYDLEGRDWHPEIIITNFEEKYQKILSSVGSKTYDTSKPLIAPVVFEDDDETTEDAYDAFQEDNEGNLQPTGFKVTQSDAETKNVLFIKLSESCDDIIPKNSNLISLCPDDPWSGGGGNTNVPKFYLDRVTVKQHKEPVGRSEINFKTQVYLVTDLPLQPLVVSEVPDTHMNTDHSFKRKWIRRKSSRVISARYIYADPVPSGQSIYYAVAVAEWDAWPAPRIEVKFSKTLPSGRKLEVMMPFHSWQSPYTNGQIKQGVPSWAFENAGIKYNFKYQ
ncbi:MAG: hypothetical protein L3J20_03450 [Flavobacteriaceae bacterium]|nr:hypothetical protein [Flavobacteriaceae bacterium]